MFRASMCPSSGEITVSIRHLVFVTVCGWPSGMQGGMKLFPSLYVYFYSLHVSGNYVPIIRRNNCINTTPGICHSAWMAVWYAGWDESWKFHPTLHTRRSSTHSDKYQVSYWYSYFSWWWAHSCPKHIENRNKHTKKELCTRLVLFTRLYRAGRSSKLRILFVTLIIRPMHHYTFWIK
jgi:hypothetical protein